MPRCDDGPDSCRLRHIVSPSLCVLFFFSSRRRHTRFDCDWSSDVCSSDLARGQHHGMRDLEAALVDARQRLHQHAGAALDIRSEEHTSELQSQSNLVCRLLLEKKKKERYHSPTSPSHVRPTKSSETQPSTQA